MVTGASLVIGVHAQLLVVTVEQEHVNVHAQTLLPKTMDFCAQEKQLKWEIVTLKNLVVSLSTNKTGFNVRRSRGTEEKSGFSLFTAYIIFLLSTLMP